MDLFSLVAKLSLDTKEYDSQVKKVEQRVIPLNDPRLGLDTEEFDKMVKEKSYPIIPIKDPELGLDTNEYDEKIVEAGDEAEDFEEKSESAFNKVKDVINKAGIVAAIASIAKAFKSAIDFSSNLGDTVDKGSKRMNITTKAYQQWDHALQQSGGNVEDLSRGLKNIRNILSDPGAENAAAEAFGELGISTADANGHIKTAEKLLEETVYALAQIEDSDKRGALVDALFGPNSGGLKPMLEDGVDGVKDLVNEAEELGLIMSDEDIQNAVEYGDAMANLKSELDMLKVEFAHDILPILKDCIEALTSIVKFFRDNGMGGGLGVGMTLATSAALKKATTYGLNQLLGGGAKSGAKAEQAASEAGAAATGAGGAVTANARSKITALATAGKLGLTGAVMLAPAIISAVAAKLIPEEYKLGSEKRVEAASYVSEDLERLKKWVEVHNQVQELEAAFGTNEFDEEKYIKAQETASQLADVLQTDLGQKFWDYLMANNITPDIDKIPMEMLENMPEIPVELTPEDDAAKKIREQVGTVTIPVQYTVSPAGGVSNAKGNWSVPYDNFPALLHRNERVLTASQARQGYGESDNGAVVSAIQGLRNDLTNLKLVVGEKVFGRSVVDYGGRRMNGYLGSAESRLAAGYGT